MAKRRISAAAMRRRAAELVAQDGETAPLSPDAASFVSRYRLQDCSDDEWGLIGPLLGGLVSRAGFTGLESVRKHCNATAAYLLWRHRQGLSLGVEVAMTHEAIDAYFTANTGTYVARTVNDYRSRLHSLASRVNPGLTAPSCTTLGAVSVAPGYTAAEEATIRRVALRQRNAAARRNLCALVGFAGGAGLTTQEQSITDTARVHDRGEEHGIHVHVAGPRERWVVVRRDYEELVRVAVAGRTPGQPLLGATPGRVGAGAHAVDKSEVFDDCPRIDSRRLRTTWITWLATRRLPLNVLMAASGLTSARTLTDIAAMLPPVDPTDVLRDGGVS